MNTPHYWSGVLRRIRKHAGLSQGQLATILGTDQPTVSRWERKLFVPSNIFQRKIEAIARDHGVATLHDVIAVVTYSPFPMILVSRQLMVIAASASSGFTADRSVNEQTPAEEQAFFDHFSRQVEASGFWEQITPKLDYEFEINQEQRKAILVPVIMSDQVYALVQKA